MKRKYVLLFLTSLLFMLFDNAFDLTKVKNATQIIVTPISYSMYQVGLFGHTTLSIVRELPNVYTNNATLRARVSELQEQIITLEDLQSKYNVLKESLDFNDALGPVLVPAYVKGAIQLDRSISIIVEAGAKDGVKEGWIAVMGEQLIGRVMQTEETYSYIQPLYSLDSIVPAQVVYTQGDEPIAKGLVKGLFNRELLLDEVLQGTSLYVGDLLETSGEGGTYPAGLVIGEVTEVNGEDEGVFKNALLEPIHNLEHIRSVVLMEYLK